MSVQDTTSKKSNFITNAADAAVDFLNAFNRLRDVRAEYICQAYNFIQNDFAGDNVYLSPAAVTNLMATFDAIDGLINTNAVGINGNTLYMSYLYNMKP
jgi:hypothetical protein